ncbi:hypothetical protein Q1695_003093 [Nippostrongylus brasiliensis]|nr:hypothetical protein Q1695_003093 [Nippostrongylus brasiliensis]
MHYRLPALQIDAPKSIRINPINDLSVVDFRFDECTFPYSSLTVRIDRFVIVKKRQCVNLPILLNIRQLQQSIELLSNGFVALSITFRFLQHYP